jgi:3-dehydroquinate synthase
MTTHKLTVQLGPKSYPIVIGAGLTATPEGKVYIPHFRGKRGVVLTNTTVAGLHLERVKNLLAASGYGVQSIIIADGEEYKNADTMLALYQRMYELGLQRDSFICALGGGVIGDLAGFAAATYMRGIDLLHVPTTLLAQVDSAIGGKNGINLPMGKNLVGSFYQPRAVISDVDFLATLPAEEFICGLGEVVKYALIAGEDFVSFLEMNHRDIMEHNPKILSSMLHYCCRVKADFVARDELEQLGVRAILNLGHTVAHALETVSGYRGMKHGTAVAVGLVAAARVSRASGVLPANELQRIITLVELFQLPTTMPPGVDLETLVTVMARDKKVSADRLNMVLLRSIGQPFLQENVSRELLLGALQECLPAAPVGSG